MKLARPILTIAACLCFVGSVSGGSIDRLPDQTMLWNRFQAVMTVDSFALAMSSEGIVVCSFDPTDSSFTQVNQLFLDDEPVGMKRYGNRLLVHTMTDSLLLVDIGKLPSIASLGGVDVGIPVSDFVLHGDDIYASVWFAGILRFTLDGDDESQFADSSMKPILVTQVEVNDDYLYGLDEYNGLFRYDLAGDGFGQFIDYLYVPWRASVFYENGEEFMIAGLNGGVSIGRFGDGITDELDVSAPVRNFLATDDWFVLLGDRSVELVGRDDLQERSTIAIGDDLPDGDLFYIDGRPHLLLPGYLGGLVLYDLEAPGQSRLAYNRPGPITGLVLRDGMLFTGGQSNPIDVYHLDQWRDEPNLGFTIYSGIQDVVSMGFNGDSLIVLYNSLNKIAFITASSDPDDYYLESSIFVDVGDAFRIEFTDNWQADRSAVLLYGATTVSVYPINDSNLVEHGATWSFIGKVLTATFADSLLFVSTGKNIIWTYRVTPEYTLEYQSTIDLATPVFEMEYLHDRLVYFTNDDMHLVDFSDPRLPREETVVTLALPVEDGLFHQDRLYTVGGRGIAVYDLTTSTPELIDWGGRPGTMLATDGQTVATSNGESIHIYYLHEDNLLRVESGDVMPDRFALSQNYPNPFNPITFIDFSLPHPAKVKVEVFNVLGQLVQTLIDTHKPAGYHTVSWNGADADGAALSSGVYFYKITTDAFTASQKMVLVR